MNNQLANRKTEYILVAEDESDLRNELLDLLRLEGFDAAGVSDGKKAFQSAKQRRPDIVISDIVMPEWDGVRLLLEMQADSELRNIPVIFLTAMVERKNVRDGMALGAADYITKPFGLKEVLSSIHAQLDKRARFEQELESVTEHALGFFDAMRSQTETPGNRNPLP